MVVPVCRVKIILFDDSNILYDSKKLLFMYLTKKKLIWRRIYIMYIFNND